MTAKSIVYLVLGLCLTAGCGSDASERSARETEKRKFAEKVIYGEAQGTTWVVRYLNDTTDYTGVMSGLLQAIDQDLSTYLDGSLINSVNAFARTDTVFSFVDSTQYFTVMFERSREIMQQTDGAFDPTVFPLVELWGFGFANRSHVTQEAVDSVMDFVGMYPSNIDLIERYRETYFYEETYIRKGNPQVRLDFNAIAQGFSVDLMADELNALGLNNYMIELGGEVYARGVNADGLPWRIAIDKPIDSEDRIFQAIVNLHNKALVTSGSYRKYYEQDGRRYSHIIDPRTGYPVTHSLLSATVLANDAAAADAFATAFMVMGVDGTKRFLAAHPELRLEAYLIYDQEGRLETWMSEGMRTIIEELPENDVA